MKPGLTSSIRLVLALALVAAALQASARPAAAGQFNIIGPAGSVRFGTRVTVLPNGNIVVTDPAYNGGLGVDVGAAYLYNGATGALISMLTGSIAGDKVGFGSVVVLSNGNYVIRSPYWHKSGAADAGAVTWGSAVSGVSGVVSAANSLVGSTAGDQVGGYFTRPLSNGNYVVSSPKWDNGGIVDAGAVTWGNGATGTGGVVSSANSLVGGTANDQVGIGNVAALSNGNYVVSSPDWDNGSAWDAGAVTWGSGPAGISGNIFYRNSLVGSRANDRVGWVELLPNGNYLVISYSWDNGTIIDAGAVTWASGLTGRTGYVSAANSLVGGTAMDQVGDYVAILSNGNYVVCSPYWNNGAFTDAGAVTWGDGASGITGLVSTVNSLVGNKTSDSVGSAGVIVLDNGNYVVRSPNWDNAAVSNAGAVTWGSGASGISGVVSAANSLVGSTAYDRLGNDVAYDDGVLPLSNGNYVVISPFWDNAAVSNAGAVTWGSGAGGISGIVSAANSLIGGKADDQVGLDYVTRLSNGNYVVGSSQWDNGAIVDAGAATWGNGAGGTSGPLSAGNSLVGSMAGDQVGSRQAALSNGNYVVSSPRWDRGAIVDAGAVTWGNGAGGTSGPVSAGNSLVGSTASDRVGSGVLLPLNYGNLMVISPVWDNGAIVNAGAVTWMDGTTGMTGQVSASNSLVGGHADDQVGSGEGIGLSNGGFVIASSQWDNGAIVDAGAVTWGDGTAGMSGLVSPANSLVGGTANDRIGVLGNVFTLNNGDYVVRSASWDNGAAVNAGAIILGSRLGATRGPVHTNHSVMGATANGGIEMVYAYDPTYRQLVVGRPYDNIVTILKQPEVYLPVVLR